MPPILIIVLVLLIIFGWFVIGEEKSFGEKITTLLIFLSVYVIYRLLNGASLKEALIDPVVYFLNRPR